MIEPLTPREQQVFNLLVRGMGNKEMATLFEISVRTVESHCRTIYQKMGVKNRTEATEVWTRRSMFVERNL